MSRVNNSQFAILGLLSICPMSGYQLKTWVDEGVGYFWDIDYKQIYPTLKKFEDTGLATFEVVRSGNRPESKVYRITEQGMKELKDWLLQPVKEGRQSTNELMLKLFFGHHIPAEINIEHLESFQSSNVEAYHDLERLTECLEAEPDKNDFWQYRMSTINRGKLLLQSEMTWCKDTIESLRAKI